MIRAPLHSGVVRNLSCGALLRPEGPKFETEGRERGRVLEERATTPIPTSKGVWGSAVNSPVGFGVDPRPQMHF